MSAAAAPTIPPRPARAPAGPSQLPDIPPRPATKKTIPNRSVSPANYPQSPLFELPSHTVGRTVSTEASTLSLPPRPPSVSLPSIGQEGNEYADIQYDDPPVEAAAQTRNVGGDLQLHAPKPSLPTASAKTQVEAVTKTTSKQAAALGIGKPSTPVQEDHDAAPVPLRAKSSFSRPASSASNERRLSVQYGEDAVLTELGIRVPINPLLGEVQAPSPAPFGDRPASMGGNGVPGQRKRHTRTLSGREVFLPPGSYGLHAHGVQTQDKFEQDWYAKHPEQYLHDEDQGHYASTGTGRGEFALSSDDLNQIVRSTASRGAGFGPAALPAYPDEQIGYLASEQYASRSSVASPTPLAKWHSNVSQPAVESPLRKTSFPADEAGQAAFDPSAEALAGRSDDVIESGAEEEVIHIDDPRHHYGPVPGGDDPTAEKEEVPPALGQPAEDGGLVAEAAYSVPILAEDEVAREVGPDDLQPAVPPNPDRRGSAYDLDFRGSGDVTPSSRPASRPASIHGGVYGVAPALSRFTSRHDDYREDMHTPLEDVDEYEPLFPDEDGQKKAVSTKERFNRPDTLKHRFPSQDIWEDTPSSAMHVATVSTPDLASQTDQPAAAATAATAATTTAASSSRPGDRPNVEAASTGARAHDERRAPSKFASHLWGDQPPRPALQPRFPSQDLWEETPNSQYLVTTVSSTQEEAASSSSSTTAKPAIPPRPPKNRAGDGASSASGQPSVPPRPEKHGHAGPPADAPVLERSTTATSHSETESALPELRPVPSIPDRPKPQVPARPAKKLSGDSGSTETERGGPVASAPPVKAKPSIPPRPGPGSKIAHLKGHFLNDLNQRLQLGPPKDKEPAADVDTEGKPLEDARKGRARGPPRRAPAQSPAPAGDGGAAAVAKPGRLSRSGPTTLWHIDPAGSLCVSRPSPPASSTPVANAPAAAAPDAPATRAEPTGAPVAPATDDGTAASKTTTTTTPPQTPLDPGSPTDSRPAHDAGDASLSQQTTASSGAASGHALGRVHAADPEPGSSVSQHTTASSGASGATVDRPPTVDDPPAGEEDGHGDETMATAGLES